MSLIDMLGVDQNGNASPLDARNTAATDPISAIERVASQKGINPDHLIGLAKLETRLGDATIKGDGQDTYNLFNIKDFSKDGTGIRARDKAEGSNDRYRKYGSYDESVEDLIGLLERRYPVALNASTPEEFANALKAGGYATDPAYVQKLTRTIGSSTNGTSPKNTAQSSGSVLDQLFSQDEAVNLISGGSDGLVESAYKPIKDRTGGQMAGDLALSLTQGGIGAVKSLTDLAGADNSASAWLDDASKGLQSAKSEYAQQTAANSQKRIEEAKGQGTMAEIGAYLDAIWDAPLDMTAQAAGSLLPFLFTGVAGAGAKALGMANAAKKAGVTKEVFLKSPAGQMAAREIAKTVGGITSKANIGMGIGMGLGGVKGQQYETTLKEAKAKGLSDAEAKKLATEAQAYGGSVGGTLQQLGGAALGGIGAATGPLERALSRIPSATQPGRGIIGRTLVGGLKEAAPEGAQGAQQAWAGNEAAVGAGVMDSSRRFEGVVGQGVQEAVLSFPMGGVAGALEAGPAPQPAPQKPPSTPIAAPPAAPTQPQTPPPAAPADPAAPTGAAPVAKPTAPSAPADPQMAAMSDADLNALIEAIDAADDDTVTDEQWSQYASAISEVNRRAAATPPAAPTAPAEDAAALAPLPTYMPGPEVNTNRAKEQPKVVLQNRDRSGAASVLQMTNIAANPDFLRVGPSTEMTTGAPVVFGDLPANAIAGRPETVVDGKGDRIQAQYAVVDAGDLIPSNNADGTSVQAYANGLPGKLRAVAGNGRTAGIQKAYQQGTAAQYRQDLIDQAKNMGLDADAIRGMRQPVLVRVMDAADVRDDMGDRTNISGTQRLSPVEQAANDARRLNLADLSFDDNGNPTQESLRQFISAMEDSEKGDLMGGKSGAPTKQAIDRLMAATFKQAYDSDELVDLYAQAPEPEARAILNAAGEAAGALAALKEMNPDFDVREAVADAVKLAVNASRQGMPLAEFAQNADLDIHPDAFPVARFLSQYANKPRQMANGLREWANDVLGQAEIDRTNQSQGGLFGEQPTLTREELFARLGNIDQNDPFSIQAREALAKREAEKAAAQQQAETVAIEDIPDDLQPEDVVEAPSDFALEAQTQEQLQAQADERAAEEKRQSEEEQAAAAKAQADAEVDSFTLTGSDRPADANPNQGDLLAADQPQQGDVLNNVGQPFASPKAAEIKAKKDGKGGQVVPVQGGYVVRMPQNMSGKASGTMGTRTDFKAGPGFTAADVVRRDPIVGQKINDEWTAFSPQSGTLGIPRAQMPQVKASDRGAMVNFLKARGIDSSKEQLPPTALKPTQAEFSPAKVQEAADRTDGDRSIIVSADGYVVDGHHQWLAQRQKGEPINVIRLDQPITQVLDALKEMPSAQPEQKPADSNPNQPQAQYQQAQAATEDVAPEVGPFGPILTQYYHDAQGAIKALTALQDGEAVAALYHPDVGDIDLVWGKAPQGKAQGLGLAKLRVKHPEVLGDLQGFLSRLKKDDDRSGPNRVRLVDPSGEAVVSLDWKGEPKRWLLTAYEYGAGAGTSMDTASNDLKGDTARLEPDSTNSVPPTNTTAQPVTRADVEAAQQQAAAIIGARIDAMSAGSKFNARQAQEAGFKAREEAKKAQRQAKRTQAAPEDTGLRVGVAPGSADPVTVRDGVVLIGDYEALNYDTGEPVIVPKGSTRADVAQALKNAGALSSRQKMFGLGDKAQDVMFSRTSDTDTQAQRQFKETERAYGGREAYDQAEPANQSQAEDRAKQDAIKAHNLPQDTVFKPGKGVNGVGKWIAESSGTRGNLAESIDAAAQSLANAIESVKRGAEKSAQYNRLAESVAAKLKAGEQPSDVELRDLFGLEPGKTYVDQSVVGGFLVDYMGVSRNKIRTSLGVAAGDRTSDGGAKYPIAYPRKLHLAFGPDPKPAASDAPAESQSPAEPNPIDFTTISDQIAAAKRRLSSAKDDATRSAIEKEIRELRRRALDEDPIEPSKPKLEEQKRKVIGKDEFDAMAAKHGYQYARGYRSQQQGWGMLTPIDVRKNAEKDAWERGWLAAKREEGSGKVDVVTYGDKNAPKTAPSDAPAEPNPLEHTPKQYAEAWLRWSAETNGLPLAEVREMQGDEAGLKAIEQRWMDAALQETKSGQPLPAKTLDKLLEIRPNTVLPESAIPAGYQRPEARKSEKEEAQARADSRRAAKQGTAPADASLEEIFTGLDSSGLPKAQATDAAKAHPQAGLIEQVNSQFHDLLLDLMETQGVLEVNGQTTETEDNKSCL